MRALEQHRLPTGLVSDWRWIAAVALLTGLSGCYSTRTIHHPPVQPPAAPTEVHFLPEGSLLIGCDCSVADDVDLNQLRKALCMTEPVPGGAGPAPEMIKIDRYRRGAGRQYCDALKRVTGSDAKCWEVKAPKPAPADPCQLDIGEAQRQLDRLVCARVCAKADETKKPDASPRNGEGAG
jgi:hypothetical protein